MPIPDRPCRELEGEHHNAWKSETHTKPTFRREMTRWRDVRIAIAVVGYGNISLLTRTLSVTLGLFPKSSQECTQRIQISTVKM